MSLARGSVASIALALLMMAFVAACAQEPQPGTKPPAAASKSDIVAGMQLPLTGPGSQEAAAYRAAIEAQIDEVNKKGGINGAAVRLRTEDDSGQTPKAISAVHRLVEENKVDLLLGSTSASATEAVLPYVMEKKIPLLFPMVALSSIYDPPRPSVFSVYPDPAAQTRVALEYLVGTIKPKRVGLLWAEADGGKAAVNAARQFLPGKRVLISTDIPAQSGTVTDYGPIVQLLKKSEPDAVVAILPAADAVRFAQAKSKAGWKVPVLGHGSLASDLLGQAGSDAEGIYGVTITASAADLPELAGLTKGSGLNAHAIYGFGAARLLQRVLSATKNAHEFASVVAGAESLRNEDVQVFPAVTFGPGRRLGVDKVAITQIRGGQTVRVTDWLPLTPSS